ncbi:dienelactone hydrolase family protein [Allohahella marinimesophila]|uniref:Dienelactone hydrolase family protein n=1 Tax=Allohahella marinimesophila TaxID=1054972 RepID=A0ABP7P3V3_9GAMM
MNMQITADDGHRFDAYAVAPDTRSRRPALILLQEIFGVNHEMRRLTEKYAQLGYHAVCPDLFSRLEPNIQLTDNTDEEWQQAFDYMNRFDIDRGIKDVQACISQVRELPGCNGRVGAVGFCLGGKLAYLTASRTDIDASTGYYGVALETLLDERENIKSPLMLHFAELDGFSSRDAREKVFASLATRSHIDLHLYKGVDHAFARHGGQNYDAQQAEIANERTAVFLDRALV